MSDVSEVPTVFLSHAYTSSQGLQFIVAGTGGGVGTTTVAALLATVMTQRTGYAPRLGDHPGGTLVSRVCLAAETGPHIIHDLGPHVAGIEALTEPSICPVIIASCDPWGIEAAESAAPTRHSLIVLNHLHPGKDKVGTKHGQTPTTTAVPLFWDPALAQPGLIDPGSVSPTTIHCVETVLRFFGI